MNPRILEPVLDKLRPGWRERRARRKSPWNLLGVLVAFALMAVIGYFLFQAAWSAHVYFHPEHAAHQREFWGAGISFRAFVPSFLLAMPLAIPAVFGGLLCANLVLWLIPPARRAMDAEAAGDPEMTFAGANAGLIKWGGIASAVCLLLSIIGILTLTTLK
jgi:hypothetical protein